MAKHIRLVRLAPEDTKSQSQAARDREAKEWIQRITKEQRIWDLRSRGFFDFGRELGED